MLSNFICYGQKYLLIGNDWEKRIELNNNLAPLYYGINKSDQQKKIDKDFTDASVNFFKTKQSAFNHNYLKAWNYFNI